MNEIIKTFQEIKEIESLEKIQSKIKLKIKTLGYQTKTSEVSPTRDYKPWKRKFQIFKTRSEKWIAQSKKMLNLKSPGTKHPEYLGYHEKTYK